MLPDSDPRAAHDRSAFGMPDRLPLAVRLQRTGLTMIVLGAVGALLYAKAIPCVFARVFRTPCPGCGSTRAVVCLLHGDFDGVLRFNPVGPVMALLIGVLALQGIVSIARYGDLRNVGDGHLGGLIKRGIFLVAAVDVVLWIARFFGALGGPVPV